MGVAVPEEADTVEEAEVGTSKAAASIVERQVTRPLIAGTKKIMKLRGQSTGGLQEVN